MSARPARVGFVVSAAEPSRIVISVRIAGNTLTTVVALWRVRGVTTGLGFYSLFFHAPRCSAFFRSGGRMRGHFHDRHRRIEHHEYARRQQDL